MTIYALRRLLLVVPLLIVISFLTFILNHLSPMNPAEAVLRAQEVPVITDELLAQASEEMGFNRPFLERYADWLGASLRLDFGDSYVTGKPVWSLLGPALLNTIKLTLVSSLLVILLSIGIGAACALREGRLFDVSARGLAFMLTAMPHFWLAALLIWLFSVKLDWLPTSGMDGASSYVLPVAVIVIGYAGIYFRVIRSSMLGQLHDDHVLYARACGLSKGRIVRRVLRNSLQVAVSVLGMAIPIILGSTVVVENVFAWPGIGSLMVKSILSRDFPMIQAYVLVLAACFVICNMAADLVQALLSPKVRRSM
ncbi:nickel/cobalt ABC transporter permease [Cohnella sp.]|uniref:nickel/cobalt ABC transporter permease n=1 Tax=Cohnella sp. TaxID=1883426 RepID=UPI003569678A